MYKIITITVGVMTNKNDRYYIDVKYRQLTRDEFTRDH